MNLFTTACPMVFHDRLCFGISSTNEQHLFWPIILIAAYIVAHLWWWDAPIRIRQFLKRNLFHDEKAYPLPPGGLGLPFVGETPSLLLNKSCSADKIGSFRARKAARHGEVCCASLPPFGKRSIIVSGPDAVQWFLSRENRGVNANYNTSFANLMGKSSLLVLTGDEHKRMRSALVHLFQPKPLQDYGETITRIARDHFRENFPSSSDGTKCLRVQDHFREIVKKIVFVVLLGQDLEKNHDTLSDYSDLLRTMSQGLSRPTIPYPGNPYFDAMKAREKLKVALMKMIRQRKALPVQTKRDVIAVLLERQEETGLTDDDVFDVIIVLIRAATNSTVNTLAFLIRFLNDNPDVLKRVRAENLSIRKAKGDQDAPLTWDDLDSMVYTNQVIFETMRAIPAIPFLRRKVKEDLIYKNYLIPKGYYVYIDLKTMHRSPSNYPNEDHFDPNRFEGQTIKKALAQPAYKPFSGGARMCLGYRLALLQLNIIFHYMVINYDWNGSPNATGETEYFPFAGPTDGVPVDIAARIS